MKLVGWGELMRNVSPLDGTRELRSGLECGLEGATRPTWNSSVPFPKVRKASTRR